VKLAPVGVWCGAHRGGEIDLEAVPIRVVNLARSPHRLAAIDQNLRQVGLSYQRIEAIDGQQLTRGDIESSYDSPSALRFMGRDLNRGEIACALSHRKVWIEVAETRPAACLVLEDDVRVGRMLVTLLSNLDLLPADWELINLITDAAFTTHSPLMDIHFATRFRGSAFGTAAYLLTPTAADKLIRFGGDRVSIPADWVAGRFEENGVTAYGIHPPIAALQDVTSDIDGRESHRTMSPDTGIGGWERIRILGPRIARYRLQKTRKRLRWRWRRIRSLPQRAIGRIHRVSSAVLRR
jgi:glycosyl transferase, family 25